MRKICPLFLSSLIFILTCSCPLHAASIYESNSKLAAVSFQRPLRPIWGPRRALVMMVSHATLKPSTVNAGRMKWLMDGVKEIYALASNRTLSLESVVVPEPVLLPGNYGDYSSTAVLAGMAVFSQVANAPDSIYTGLALHNPQSRAAQIEVKVFTSGGSEAGSGNFKLAPGCRISKLLTELVPSSLGVVGGYVLVQSTEPLVLQQVFGDTRQSYLAAVPPTVIEQPKGLGIIH